MVWDKTDRAITGLEQDRFDRLDFVQSVRRSVLEKKSGKWQSRGTVVGITGQWGAGKSSVLNILAEQLSALSGVVVVRFDPWVISDRDDLIDVYFRELIREVGKSPGTRFKELANSLDDYRDAIGQVANYAFPGAGLVSKVFPKFRKPTLREAKKKLEVQIEKFDSAIVVLIDELDRLHDEEIKELSKFLKAVADFPNVSYVTAYDPKRVNLALSREGEGEFGENYLKKIIQLNLPLRPMFDYELVDLLDEIFGAHLLARLTENEERWRFAKDLIVAMLETPRDLKRTAENFEIISSAVANEIDPIDILGYAALGSHSSILMAQIHESVDQLVINPAMREPDWVRFFEDKRDGQRSAVQRLGLGVDDYQRAHDLLNFLFPSEPADEDRQAFGRIFDRNNLLTLIYLGNPPFRLSRRVVEEYWENPRAENIRQIIDSGRLQDFLGLLEVLFSDLPSVGDAPAITILLEGLRFDGPAEQIEARQAIDSVKWSLVRISAQDEDARQRVAEIWAYLRETDEVILSSELFRHHAFSFGRAEGFEARNTPTSISVEHFDDIAPSELMRFRNFILENRWMDNLTSADVFYALQQAGQWDAELEQALAETIQNHEDGIGNFAAIFLARGYRVERGVIGQFVSEDLLRQNIDREYEDAFIQNAMESLREYLGV